MLVASVGFLFPRDVTVRRRGADGILHESVERKIPLKQGLDLQGGMHLVLEVDDVPAEVERLRSSGVTFRNDPVTGPGGTQVVLEDPSGNPVELFRPR